MVRRVLPFGAPAIALSFVLGAAFGGWGAAWSAAIGTTVVALNFVANGLSVAWAARISPTVLFAVALGGFAVRLGIILAIMVLLNTFDFFSPLAFGLAVIPSTVLLLVFEMRLLSGGLQTDLWRFPSEATR